MELSFGEDSACRDGAVAILDIDGGRGGDVVRSRRFPADHISPKSGSRGITVERTDAFNRTQSATADRPRAQRGTLDLISSSHYICFTTGQTSRVNGGTFVVW